MTFRTKVLKIKKYFFKKYYFLDLFFYVHYGNFQRHFRGDYLMFYVLYILPTKLEIRYSYNA